jgi:uncharacterized protein
MFDRRIRKEDLSRGKSLVFVKEIEMAQANEILAEELSVDKDSLLGQWRNTAYNQNADQKWLEKFWSDYFQIEKNIYAQLLMNPDEVVKGTVKELAGRFNVDISVMVGFLDGINDSLIEKNPIETMTEDTEVNLGFDKTRLYQNMVDAKADWLYGLPEWDAIFDKETQHKLYLEQKKAGTVIKPKKIGRNDPCPCGSGKKYKKCHGLPGMPPLEGYYAN